MTIPDDLFDDYPYLVEIYDSLSSAEENLAFLWAVQQYVPFQQEGAWLLTTYERLVEEAGSEVERIFSYLERPVPDAAIAQLDRQSSSGSSYESAKRDRLADWKNRLTSSQIRHILEVTHRVGVTCYTEALHPDYDAMPL